MARTAGAAAAEWLVCLGTHRDVADGAVDCPASGSPVPVADCLECRHLGNLSNDRGASRWCAIGEDAASSHTAIG